jgi:hypothetical protein
MERRLDRRLAHTLVSGWIAFAALGVGCGKDDSLGNDKDDTLAAAGKGGSDAASGVMGGQASGGRSEATPGGEGGAGSEPGGDGGASGGKAPATGGTVSATGGTVSATGGTAPVTGGTTTTGGTAEPAGGSAGADDPGDVVTETSDVGTGPCSETSVADVLEQIAVLEPGLTITGLTSLDSFRDRGGVIAVRNGDGFRVVVSVGAGDCQAGCIDREYWYFETDAECHAVRVGHYARLQSDGCLEIGAPLWDLPEPPAAGTCAPLNPDDLNTNCINDACPSALEAVHFYGAAGTSGPEFCMCVITCEAQGDAGLCPEGTRCQYIADGPGEVCWGT